MIKTSRDETGRAEYAAALNPPAEARTYTVTGSARVFGLRPGATFERVIPSAQEARLIASGAIRREETETPDDNTGNVFERPECTFNYCPDPDGCQQACVSPRAEVTDGVEQRPEEVRGEPSGTE